MSSTKKPVDDFVTPPITGTEMRPANWHAAVDGLEFEQFTVDDFANGDARVIAVMTDVSELPPLNPGQVWHDPSDVISLFLESTVSFGMPFGFGALEMLGYATTGVSIGTPLYAVGLYAPASGVSNWVVTRWQPSFDITVEADTRWRPVMGFSQTARPDAGLVRVGIAGMMRMWTVDSNVTSGDGAYFAIATSDKNLLAQPADDFFANPAGRAAVGIFLEASAAGNAPLLGFKAPVPWDEDR